MTAFALVFPGQGSQSVGMMAGLAAAHPEVRATFDEASAAVGFDLWQLVSAGPEEVLGSTENTQPAMLAAGVATWRLWGKLGGPAPVAVAGHSLGEFTALVCAGALDFAPAAALVRERGRIMQSAVPAGQGAMAALLGLEEAQVEAACQEAAQGGVVEAVNFNSPGQVVIAGQREAVERAMALAKARGAKRAVLLPVSVPSHSSLMRPAMASLRQRLDQVELRAPKFAFVSSVDAAAHADPVDIRNLLERQLASPVRWSATVSALLARAPLLIECGPGKVLTGLNKRIERNARCLALEDEAGFAEALTQQKEV